MEGDPRSHTKNSRTHLSFTDRGQFNDRNPACGYVESDAPGLFVHNQSSIRGPFRSIRDRRTTQAYLHVHARAAIDLGQALLRLEHTVVVEERDDPTACTSID